ERVVELLLKNGASPNAIDHSGFSVLMVACGRNNENILGQLIEAGANIHARNPDSTPLHEAAGCNFHEAVRTLLALGADPTQTNHRGMTPEEFAVECGFDETVAVLRSIRKTT